MPFLLIALLGFAPAFAESVQAVAPWLTVYDEAGRPKWEVRMEVLVRTTTGWEGEGVEVQLYLEGAPHLVLRAPRLRADRYGREWTLGGEADGAQVAGEGDGFSFTCNEARWTGGLILLGLAAAGHGVTLSAAEARWLLGETVELLGAQASFGGWTVTFDSGRYDLTANQLVTGPATATGHGLTLRGAALQAWPTHGEILLTEAILVRTP